MKISKYFSAIACCGLLLIECSADSGKKVNQTGGEVALTASQADVAKCFIQGSIQNLKTDATVEILEVGNGYQNPKIATVQVGTNGIFKVEVPAEPERAVQVNLPGGPQIFLIVEKNGEILISYDASKPEAINIEGSMASIELSNLNAKLSNVAAQINALQQQESQLNAQGKTGEAKPVKAQFETKLAEYYTTLKTTITVTKSNILKLYALNYLDMQKEYAFAQSQLASLSAYSKHPYYEGVVSMVAQARQWIGEVAPEISLPNPDGKTMTLSSLKGKVVLLDFWASWCRPCRMENPTVVKAYDKYKGKGFTVFSVSLDNKRDPWLAAIQADNLKWDTHVSELGGWGTQAIKPYGVNSIPATFLIGKDGKIVAKNLRGEALEAKLKELLGE